MSRDCGSRDRANMQEKRDSDSMMHAHSKYSIFLVQDKFEASVKQLWSVVRIRILSLY